jgi:hypothetical protein
MVPEAVAEVLFRHAQECSHTRDGTMCAQGAGGEGVGGEGAGTLAACSLPSLVSGLILMVRSFTSTQAQYLRL